MERGFEDDYDTNTRSVAAHGDGGAKVGSWVSVSGRPRLETTKQAAQGGERVKGYLAYLI